ncbi:hypothetical protein MSG28_014228 [Choristoneura fumiferana]|uniref:Uncharacterized protein n=1 Tax=Choristoneura fumiferana TaxID=7141 RepID=A0ACC0JGA3_CHOFU|nr:hypothetical protein MSG28_014228 [Choristoneura fumiferana]
MSVRVQEQSSKAIPLKISKTVYCRFEKRLQAGWLESKGLGINVNCEYIMHLRFAEDILVTAKSMDELSTMLDGFNRVSQRII